jgi:HTH-type transcriptional regulator, competence development regulator
MPFHSQEPDAEPFGDLIRRAREAQGITLRKFADRVGMSATYLSKVERGEFAPPAEEKIKAIARVLSLDPDELLGRAGRVPSELGEIIKSRPKEMAMLLRAAKTASRPLIERHADALSRSAVTEPRKRSEGK